MSTITEQIAKEKEKLEQLKRRKKAQEQQKKVLERKENNYRAMIIGRLVVKYFLEVMRFKPQKTNAENNVEFAQVENFLAVLAANPELKNKISEVALASSLNSRSERQCVDGHLESNQEH